MLTACGPDLGKQNFPRTTITVSAQSTGGEITDSAVSLTALRTIDPCGLVDASTLGDLGTLDGTNASGLDGCTNVVHDAGGKRLQVDLTLGQSIAITNNTSGAIQGLPLIVDDVGGSQCDVTALTSTTPSLGITAGISYPGGDACGAGQTVLTKVIQKIHSGASRLSLPPGSAIAVDLCTVPDKTLMATVLGRGSESSPGGLHRCQWSGGAANGYLSLDEIPVPATGDGVTTVDLGGTTGFQKLETNAGKRCTISWLQRATKASSGEVVSFLYNNYHDDAAKDDACGKALQVARAVLPKLPKA